MPSFADIEARATAAVFRRLPNARARFMHANVLEPVYANVVFDPAMSVVDAYGVIVNQPTLLMTPDVAPLIAEGDMLTLTRLTALAPALGSYTVRSVMPLAEGGFQRVTLAKE